MYAEIVVRRRPQRYYPGFPTDNASEKIFRQIPLFVVYIGTRTTRIYPYKVNLNLNLCERK